MALRNFTGDETHISYENQSCSAELTGGLQKQLIFVSVLNVFLSITAVLGNTLILAALHKKPSLHPPSKLLLQNLAVTDLCVGLIAEPLAVTYWISVISERWNVCRYTFGIVFLTSYMLVFVSLLTMTAISVNRLLSLLLGLRYRQVVTLKRTRTIVFVFWVASIVGTTFSILSEFLALLYSYGCVALCLVISVSSYTKIFLTLRRSQRQVQNSSPGQQRQGIPLDISRYRKAAHSALWIQLAFVICYLPYYVMVASTHRSTPTTAKYLAGQVIVTFVYLNSSINPFLYCWKIREIRQAVKETIRHLLRSSC